MIQTFVKSVLTVLLFAFLFFWYIIRPNIPTPHESLGLHYGSNQTTEFFDAAEAAITKARPIDDRVAGFTVNHHLLAPHLVAKQFALVERNEPVTVVLISPNHFLRGEGGAITSLYDWQTPYGVLENNQKLVDKLYKSGLVNIDEKPFEHEHGISGIVGFIKKYLPQASLVPIIVKDNFSDQKVDELAKELAEILPKDSLVVGSLDFSHYLTSNAAEFHDIQALATINNFDYDRIDKLDIDSQPGLRLLLQYFDLIDNKKFVLVSHENSSTVTGNFTFAETTSYINGYFTKGENPKDNRKTVLYSQGVGDDLTKANRLFIYNDEITKLKPKELNDSDLGNGPLAAGLVYDDGLLTDVYLIPLEISGNEVKLLTPDKTDKIKHISY